MDPVRGGAGGRAKQMLAWRCEAAAAGAGCCRGGSTEVAKAGAAEVCDPGAVQELQWREEKPAPGRFEEPIKGPQGPQIRGLFGFGQESSAIFGVFFFVVSGGGRIWLEQLLSWGRARLELVRSSCCASSAEEAGCCEGVGCVMWSWVCRSGGGKRMQGRGALAVRTKKGSAEAAGCGSGSGWSWRSSREVRLRRICWGIRCAMDPVRGGAGGHAKQMLAWRCEAAAAGAGYCRGGSAEVAGAGAAKVCDPGAVQKLYLEKVSILRCAKNSRQRKCTINNAAFTLAPLPGRHLHKKWSMEIGLDI
ncbi:hypothetical protein Taro_002009 [Colocasia esculenta]|uniref:Uncharacterized protein n=1 Tax=Colocasia esculenta TaxID=4460 RepID=A0A843TBJ6_COLES|nr:hypothetical protein [Colocasia esculenta]